MSKLPDPTMTVWPADKHLRVLRHAAWYSNEHLIDALCEMAHEEPTPVEAIKLGLRKLSVSRALLRCPENQED